jgi:Tol biopolymer transport system component
MPRAQRAVALGAVALLTLTGATASAQRLAPPSTSYWDPAWSPDGSRIAFVDRGGGRGDLYVMDAVGGSVRRLTRSRDPSEYGARWPTWSPDGRRIAFAYGYYGIAVIGADGNGYRKLTSAGDQPAWSPGGRKIAFALGEETSGNAIYAMNPDGSRRTLVARPDILHSFNGPTWSPDGERLAFSANSAPDTGEVGQYLATVSGYRARPRRLARGNAGSPDWSPDGRRIVFADFARVSATTPNPFVAVLDLRTQKMRRLRVGWHPRWSPDGRSIAYVCPPHLCAMRADGSAPRRLTR